MRYYGWYSNKMRGQRAKHATEEAQVTISTAVKVIDVSEHQPRRIPSAKWRELINLPAMLRISLQAGKVWLVLRSEGSLR